MAPVLQFHHADSGQAVAMMFVATFLGLVAGVLTIDIGLILNEKRQVQAAADFAALAAAQDLPRSETDPNLTTKITEATNTAYEYLAFNGYDDAEPDVDATVNTSYTGDVDKIEVVVSHPRPWMLGKLFGLGDITVEGRAVAAANALSRDIVVVLDRSGSMCLYTHGGPMSYCPPQPFPSVGEETSSSTPNPLETTMVGGSGDMMVVAATAGNSGSYTANNGFSIGVNQTDGGTMTFATAEKLGTGATETVSMQHSNPNRQILGATTLPGLAGGVSALGTWGTGTSHSKPAGSNRYLVFMAGWEDSGRPDITSVRYGGQDLDKVYSGRVGSGPRAGVEIWVLDEAGIAAASSSSFSVNWDEGVSYLVYGHRFYGNVDQSGDTSYEPWDTVAEASLNFANLFVPYVEGVPFDYMSIVSYSSEANLDMGLSLDYVGAGSQYASVVNAIVPAGSTNIGHAIYKARTELADNGNPGNVPVIVLLSDGVANVYLQSGTNEEPTWGSSSSLAADYALNEATAAAQAGMAIYTIGVTGAAGEDLLRDIADIGANQGQGGQYFDVDDPADLNATFEQIAELLNYALIE